MTRSYIKVLRFFNEIFFSSFWGLIHHPWTLRKIFRPYLAHYESSMQEWNIIIFRLGSGVLFWVRKNYTVASCIFFLWIVKSLQFHGCRQIVDPLKYCLVIHTHTHTHTQRWSIPYRYRLYWPVCTLSVRISVSKRQRFVLV